MHAHWKAALLLVPVLSANGRLGGTGAASDLCSLFTTAEIKEILGASVNAGRVAGPAGSACHWSGTAAGLATYAQVQVIKGTEYWTNPTNAKGYEAVQGVGKEAFVIREGGGWAAGSLTDTAVFGASVSGGTAKRETAVQLLRALMARAK